MSLCTVLGIWKVRSKLFEKETIFPICSNEISYLCSSTVDYHLQKCSDDCIIWAWVASSLNVKDKRLKVTLKVRVRSWLTWKHWVCLYQRWHGKNFLVTDILQIQCHELLFLLFPSYHSFSLNFQFSYFLRSGSNEWMATDDL